MSVIWTGDESIKFNTLSKTFIPKVPTAKVKMDWNHLSGRQKTYSQLNYQKQLATDSSS